MVLFLLFSMLASFARFNAEDNSGWGAKEVAAALKEAGVDEATQKAATGAAKALGGLLNK